MIELDIVVEELTIFETLNSFDESRANWRHLPKFNTEYCDVLAYVPKQALSIEENDYFHRDKRKNFEYGLWENHCFAIWRYHQTLSWDKASELLQRYRDNDKPVYMRIYKNKNLEWFVSTQVVKYL